MDKETLRSQKRSLRLALTAAEVEKASKLIIQNLIGEINWTNLQSLHTFVPISKLNEVNTWPLLKYIWQNHPRIVTAIPTRRQEQLGSIRANQATRWRGLLPSSTLTLPPDYKFDVVIVPTLAFDKRGFRLGWGGGFYDRFLATQPQALKIGLCPASGQLDKLPNEPHDIRLDKVITEANVYALGCSARK